MNIELRDGESNLANHNLIELYLSRYDSKSTREAYRSDLVDFFRTRTVSLERIEEVTFVDVNQYLDLLLEEKSNSTVRRRISSIRGFYDWLIALDVVNHNPAAKEIVKKIKPTNANDRPVKFLTKSQATKLIGAASNLRDKTLIKVLLYCVLRRGEAAAMDIEHIEQVGNGWILNIPKAKGGDGQYVKMPDHLVADIHKMCQHYGIKSGQVWRSHSNNNRGGRLSGTAIYNIVRKTSERIDLKIGPHVLRHTGCTIAIYEGAEPLQVKRFARHKKLDTTMLYVHQKERMEESASDYLDFTEDEGMESE